MMQKNALPAQMGGGQGWGLSSLIQSLPPFQAARYQHYLNVVYAGTPDERLKLTQTLRDHVLQTEANRQYPNGYSDDEFETLSVDESYHPIEITMLQKLAVDFDFSGAYRLKMREIANNVATEIAQDRDMQYAQRHWHTMDTNQQKSILRKAQQIHARAQELDGVKTHQTLSIVFNNEARDLPNGKKNPFFTYAAHSDSLHNIFNSKALGWIFGKPDSVIHFNMHPDNAFMRGGFATALSAIHHEQQHAFQASLALAYFEKRLDPNSTYYKDAEMLYRLRMHDCYVQPSIYTVYRTQALERDAFDFQDLMQTHLKRPFVGGGWATDPTQAQTYAQQNGGGLLKRLRGWLGSFNV